MKKAVLFSSLLILLASCEQKEEEEDLSDLKQMVQVPKEAPEPDATQTR